MLQAENSDSMLDGNIGRIAIRAWFISHPVHLEAQVDAKDGSACECAGSFS